MINKIKSILSIAGFDPSSGAGISMDIKIASKLNSHLVSAPTCLTVQNSKSFESINAVDSNIIKSQIDSILDDVEVELIKIGLLPNKEIIRLVSDIIDKRIILDPIITSTTGKKILEDDVVKFFKENLIAKSYLITPNINEASILSDIDIVDRKDLEIAAKTIQNIGAKNVLIKGGHLNEENDKIEHFLLKEGGKKIIIKNNRIKLDSQIRGTGCAFSTAICCFLSQNLSLEEAIQKADNFINEQIQKAVKIGQKLIMT